MSSPLLSSGQGSDKGSTPQKADTPGNLPAPLGKLVEDACRVYCVRDVMEQAAIFNRSYAPNVEFQDNIACSKGIQGMRMQFYSLIRLFSSVEVQAHSATVKTGISNQDLVEVEVPTTQTYGFARSNFVTKRTLPEQIVLDTTMTLTIDRKTSRIVKHIDFWKDKFLPPQFLRRFNALNSNGVMTVIGWGSKVHKAAQAAPGGPK